MLLTMSTMARTPFHPRFYCHQISPPSQEAFGEIFQGIPITFGWSRDLDLIKFPVVPAGIWVRFSRSFLYFVTNML